MLGISRSMLAMCLFPCVLSGPVCWVCLGFHLLCWGKCTHVDNDGLSGSTAKLCGHFHRESKKILFGERCACAMPLFVYICIAAMTCIISIGQHNYMWFHTV